MLTCPRIFSARIREPGMSAGVASQWLFNFIFSLTTPYMMDDMGWGTFLLWGVFDVVIALVVFFYVKETKGLSLEQINQRGAGGDPVDPDRKTSDDLSDSRRATVSHIAGK